MDVERQEGCISLDRCGLAIYSISMATLAGRCDND